MRLCVCVCVCGCVCAAFKRSCVNISISLPVTVCRWLDLTDLKRSKSSNQGETHFYPSNVSCGGVETVGGRAAGVFRLFAHSVLLLSRGGPARVLIGYWVSLSKVNRRQRWNARWFSSYPVPGCHSEPFLSRMSCLCVSVHLNFPKPLSLRMRGVSGCEGRDGTNFHSYYWIWNGFIFDFILHACNRHVTVVCAFALADEQSGSTGRCRKRNQT